MDDIAKIDGQDGWAAAGHKPWHSKGIKVPGLMTVKEALIVGRADWEVTRVPLMLQNLSMTPVENFWATVRNGPETDEGGDIKQIPLGIVGKKYTIVQNHEAFDFFNTAIYEGVACIETIGVLGNGETVFAVAKIPQTFEPVPGDPVEAYILLITTHDGSGSIRAIFMPFRLSCTNMLIGVIKGAKNIVKIRHTKSAQSRLKMAHELMGISDTYWKNLSDCYKQLAMSNMNRLDVIEFIKKLFPGQTKEVVKNGVAKKEDVVSTRTKNNRLKVFGLYEGEAKGARFAPGTKWQAFNAVTEYIDHERSIRKNSNAWESSVFGSQAQLMRQKALNLLLAP